MVKDKQHQGKEDHDGKGTNFHIPLIIQIHIESITYEIEYKRRLTPLGATREFKVVMSEEISIDLVLS